MSRFSNPGDEPIHPWGITANQTSCILLEKVKLHARQFTSTRMMDEMRAEVWVDHCARSLVAQLQTCLLAENMGEQSETVELCCSLTCSLTTTVEVPDTWADHFKQTYGPETWRGWAFRLLWPGPVVMRKETLTESVTEKKRDSKKVVYRHMVGYPKLALAIPGDQTFIQVPFSQRLS